MKNSFHITYNIYSNCLLNIFKIGAIEKSIFKINSFTTVEKYLEMRSGILTPSHSSQSLVWMPRAWGGRAARWWRLGWGGTAQHCPVVGQGVLPAPPGSWSTPLLSAASSIASAPATNKYYECFRWSTTTLSPLSKVLTYVDSDISVQLMCTNINQLYQNRCYDNYCY